MHEHLRPAELVIMNENAAPPYCRGGNNTGALKTITDAQPVGQRQHETMAVVQITHGREFEQIAATKRGISQSVSAATCLFVFSNQAQ